MALTSTEKQAAIGNPSTNKADAIRDLNSRLLAVEAAVDAPIVVVLADAAPSTLFTVAIADGAAEGGIVEYKVKATDGTDTQSVKGKFQWSAVRKGATITVDIQAVSQIMSRTDGASTINVSVAGTGTAGVITLTLTADSSLTVTAESVSFTHQEF